MDIYEATELMARRSVAVMFIDKYKIDLQWWSDGMCRINCYEKNGELVDVCARFEGATLLEVIEKLVADESLTLELLGLEGGGK